MNEELTDISYITEPRFIRYSQDMFRSGLRLPMFGVILALTPAISESFRHKQVAEIAQNNRGDTYRELQLIKNMDMIWQVNSYNQQERVYFRSDSPKWEIAKRAITIAREELGL